MSKTDWHSEHFAGQHENEKVELVFHQHPIVMRKALLLSLVVFTLGSLPLSVKPLESWPWKLLLASLVLALLIFLYRWISWYYSIFIISNERLIQIKQKGFFNRSVADISHGKIQSVNYEVKGFQATLFHFGDINVQTYVGELVLRFIHNPEPVHQLLVRMIREVPASTPRGPSAGE